MSTAAPLVARPMSVGELLDGAIAIYRKNFLALIGIVAIVNIPYLIVQIAAIVLAFPTDLTSFSRQASTPFSDSFFIYFLVLLLVSIPVGIAYIFQQGALTVVASEFFLGRRAGIKQAYGRAFHRGWSLFGTQFVVVVADLLILGLLMAPILGMVLVAPSASGSVASAALALAVLCLCVAFLPALALLLILNMYWIFWPQAVLLENQGVRSGLGRSWQLVRGSFWRILLIVAMAEILISIITATPTYAISFMSIMVPSPLLASAFNSTVSILISIVMTPLWCALLTLLYYDVRIRKEGFDLELQASQLAESPG